MKSEQGFGHEMKRLGGGEHQRSECPISYEMQP